VVLILSMYDEALYAERALVAGARGYVTKRETTQKVVEAIRSVLEGRLYVSDAMTQTMLARYVEGKTPANGSPIAQLSDREFTVFEMLGRGLSTRQISQRLGLSIKTVQSYCARIKQELGLQSGMDLLREAFRHNESNAGDDGVDQSDRVLSPPNLDVDGKYGSGNSQAKEDDFSGGRSPAGSRVAHQPD
jgi:DNA-binding NarL/FixJ family response regulator